MEGLPPPTNAASLIGYAMGVGAFVFVFMVLQFVKGRADRKDPGEIASQAVGAAFVDRSTSNAITKAAHDIEVIRAILEERQDKERDRAIVIEVERKMREREAIKDRDRDA